MKTVLYIYDVLSLCSDLMNKYQNLQLSFSKSLKSFYTCGLKVLNTNSNGGRID